MEKIILASASPRRKELMTMAGLTFDVIVSDCEENISYESPEDMVKKLSLLKAKDVADKIRQTETEPHLVIGSDTIVFFQNQILGKPKNEEDAFHMLKAMSGNIHTVYTGVTIIDTANNHTDTLYDETRVEFDDVTDEEIRNYIATG
ncbi:MAG: septum formation protein Maf, partial [Lachnospiraceae bacterium]|nr:septum formation protein Maf [Lachnospiraceae bacterium]